MARIRYSSNFYFASMASHLSLSFINPTNLDILVLVLCAFITYTIRSWISASNLAKHLPPGPPRRPIIGNLLDLPKEQDWLQWAKHRKLYGPISSVSVFGYNIIVVNDLQIAQDIMEKRSAIYSDRPRVPFGGDMVGWGKTTALLDYGSEVKAHRRNSHQIMGTPKAASKFHYLQDIEAKKLVKRILERRESLDQLLRVFVLTCFS